MTIAARFATFEVVELRDEIPAQPAGDEFVVVPRALLAAALIDRPLASTSLFVRAPASAADPLRDAATAAGVNARVESQSSRLATLRGRPLVEAVGIGFGLALAAAVASAGVALRVLGLGAFLGAEMEPALFVDATQLAVLTAAVIVIVLIGMGLAAWA